MARIINEFTNGNVGVISAIGTESFAYDVYDALKKVDEQLAIYFLGTVQILQSYWSFNGCIRSKLWQEK